MKCETCGGSVVEQKGYCQEPDRLFCVSCGREPGQPKRKEEEMYTKTCSHCGENKPATLEFFHKGKRGAFGLNSICKECRSKKWREENPRKKHRQPQNSPKNNPHPRPPTPKNKTASDGIPLDMQLDMQLIRATRKSVADQIIKIIQEAFI